jgi:hypothetical protein
MGHICVVMRATHDMRPAGRMFDMPDIDHINLLIAWLFGLSHCFVFFVNSMYGCVFCVLLFDCVNCVLLLLCCVYCVVLCTVCV